MSKLSVHRGHADVRAAGEHTGVVRAVREFLRHLADTKNASPSTQGDRKVRKGRQFAVLASLREARGVFVDPTPCP